MSKKSAEIQNTDLKKKERESLVDGEAGAGRAGAPDELAAEPRAHTRRPGRRSAHSTTCTWRIRV